MMKDRDGGRDRHHRHNRRRRPAEDCERRIKRDVLKCRLVDRARALVTVFGATRRKRDTWLD